MGTETRYQYISDCNQDIAKVELNNPQMGTETYFSKTALIKSNSVVLN